METEDQNGGFFDAPAPTPQPVGIYGWRKRCLYAFVLCLMIIVIMNLALTIWILRVLHFSLDGMGKLKVAPGGIVLDGEAEFLKPVYVQEIKSVKDEPLHVMSQKKISLLASSGDVNSTTGSQISIGEENIEAKCDKFLIQNTEGKVKMMITGGGISFGSEDVKMPVDFTFNGSIATPTVTGPRKEKLKIQSKTSKVEISGNGGVTVSSEESDVSLKAGGDVYITTTDGGIHINSETVQLSGIPEASSIQSSSPSFSYSSTASRRTKDVFQLCACQNGKVFLDLPDAQCKTSTDICGG